MGWIGFSDCPECKKVGAMGLIAKHYHESGHDPKVLEDYRRLSKWKDQEAK